MNINSNDKANKIIKFLDLPKEEIQRILSYLTINEVSAISKANNLMHAYSLPILWKQFKQYTILNPLDFEFILKKYGKFIKLLMPNSLPGGLHKFNINKFYQYCPNIEVFYLNLFDFEYFENYKVILNNWKNIKALSIIKDFEYELMDVDSKNLSKLNTLKLVNFYIKSNWIEQLKIRDNILKLSYEFTNYNFNNSLDFQFNLFNNLEHLVLNLNFFSILRFELIDNILTNIQNLVKLKNLEIYSKSYFETSVNSGEFIPFSNIFKGFSQLNKVILDLYGILNSEEEELSGSEVFNLDNSEDLKPFQLTKFFTNLCPNLTLLYILFMDDSLFQIILVNCPNLKNLGTHTSIPLLYEVSNYSLSKLTHLTITDTCRSAFYNQQNYRFVFPNLINLYITGSQLPAKYINHLSCFNSIPLIFPKLKKLQINTDFTELPLHILKKSRFSNLIEIIIKLDNLYGIKDKLLILIENCSNLKFIKFIINDIKFGIEDLIEDDRFREIKFYWANFTKKFEFGLNNEKLIN